MKGVDRLPEFTNKTQLIRNMTVIAHVDHGKTTLTDLLLNKAGFVSDKDAGKKLKLDDMEEEQEKGITIKASSISMIHQHSSLEDKSYLIHLIDSPGHIDFSSEVTAALRVTDGCLVIVDFVDGVCVQTETVLRQALAEKVTPVLMINKFDKGIDLMREPEDFYQRIVQIIEEVNNIIRQYSDDESEENYIDPIKGNVCFGSGYFGWAFSIQLFAKKYAETLKVDEEKMATWLWGDYFYNGKSFTKTVGDLNRDETRGFNKYIMTPIINLHRSIMENDTERQEKILKKIGVHLNTEEKEDIGRELLRTVFKKWINCADTVMDMICDHLPSPDEAQRERILKIYNEDVEDEEEETKRNTEELDLVKEALMKCDPNGPTMVCISKIVPFKSGLMAFGRVFSGTIETGQKVRVITAEGDKG